MAEAGYDDFVVEQWQAVYAPARTPAPIAQKLNKLVNEALKQPEISASLTKLGVTVAGGEPEALTRRQEADSARWGKVISDARITLE
jgi:tripartite-type tricarboxylate transporter receptor subunit TctC